MHQHVARGHGGEDGHGRHELPPPPRRRATRWSSRSPSPPAPPGPPPPQRRQQHDGPSGGDGPPGLPPPPGGAPPPVGSIHRAVVRSARPFGVFVSLLGLRCRDVLVHHSQVAEGVTLGRGDEDELKVKALEYVAPPGE